MSISFQSDVRSALHFATAFLSISPSPILPRTLRLRRLFHHNPTLSLRAFTTSDNIKNPASSASPASATAVVENLNNKSSLCTADELHYVSVPNSDWRLALWRYHPNPKATKRNHPLLLLSGVGTNAIGYDLAPESSFARHMSAQGFDTWILEVRGAGLSMQLKDCNEAEKTAHAIVEEIEASSETVAGSAGPLQKRTDGDHVTMSKSETMVTTEDDTKVATIWDESEVVTQLTETFMRLSERLSGFLSDGQSRIMSAKLFDQISRLLEDSQLIERFNEIREKLSCVMEERQSPGQIRDLSETLVNVVEEGQRSVSPQFFNLQERFSATIDDFQKQLDLIVKYDWDFDTMLEEDVPAVIEYIRAQCKPKDDKIFAIGHSMGGILLYALLSRYGYEGKDPMLAGVVTLASSIDYTTSKSSLKMLLPLADPAQLLQVPVVPLGALLTAIYPLSSRPPYVFSWLNNFISAEDMMHPELLEKLVLNNFCTVPAKLLIQLTTAFKEGGLCNRDATFFFRDHLHKSNVPVLALAGDCDMICPPEAVHETVKLIPEELVTYKVLGESGGARYAHYDLVGGKLAVEQVYPCIVEFLSTHD